MTRASQPSRRLGVFGGAFDPPHRAHAALAELALQQLGLDELRVFPTGQAWHKTPALSAPEHRLAMARLALGALPGVRVEDAELRRSGPTYTVDTLSELAAAEPGASLFLVIGEDQALALTRWHRWRDVLQLATICVASRAPMTGHQGPCGTQVPAPSPDGQGFGLPDLAPELRAAGQFVHLNLPAMPVSATVIRERVRNGLGIDDLVTPAVARYIVQHHLYRLD